MKDSELDCLLMARVTYFESTYASHCRSATMLPLFENAVAMHSSLVGETEPSGWI